MATATATKAPPKEASASKKRMLFNRSAMNLILPPVEEGGQKRVFETGKAFEAKDAEEEKILLDYRGVVYADTIVPETESTAALLAKVKTLTDENERLKAERDAAKK